MWPLNRDDRSESNSSFPEPWLAAYVDGELGEEERTRVEAWLARDPDARAEVESQRRLKSWVEAGAAPEPDARLWDEALSRVEAALFPGAEQGLRPARRQPSRIQPWLWAVGAVTAAAVLLALWVGNRRQQPPDRLPAADALEVVAAADVVIDEIDPADAGAVVVGRMPAARFPELGPGQTLEVAESTDVTVISMDAADTAALVVGEPPVAGALVLAAQGDVQVDHLAPHPTDAAKPYLHSPKNGWPMLVAPLKTARANKD